MKQMLLCILLECILFGCSDHYTGDDSVDSIKSERTIVTRLVDLSRFGINEINGFVKKEEELIVGTTYMAEGVGHSLDLKHLGSENFTAKSLVLSKRIRSLSSFNSFDGTSVTALDFEKGELIETYVSPLARGVNKESIIKLPAGKQHLIAVKAKDFVLSTGFYDEGRYLLYSLENGTTRYFLSYPDHSVYPNLQEKTKAILYASNILRIRPDQSAFVCADMYSGVIDFCRIESNVIERVKMVRLHYPNVKIRELPTPRVEYYQNNRFGFSDVAVTDEKVYALYSGKNYQEAGSQASGGQTLLVYDWDGNLLASHELDVSLSELACDRMENSLYGISCDSDLSLMKLRL